MTLTDEECSLTGSFYSISKTEDRGRAVYACRLIPSGSTVHIASDPVRQRNQGEIQEGSMRVVLQISTWQELSCQTSEHANRSQVLFT